MYQISDKNNTFVVKCSKDHLLDKARELIGQFEPGKYVAHGTSPEWGDPCLDEKTYEQNVQEFIQEIDSLLTEENCRRLPDVMPRKKNGRFVKNRIHEICSCKNCQVIHEWHNTWIYQQVFVKALDENTLEVSMRSYTDTPG